MVRSYFGLVQFFLSGGHIYLKLSFNAVMVGPLCEILHIYGKSKLGRCQFNQSHGLARYRRNGLPWSLPIDNQGESEGL